MRLSIDTLDSIYRAYAETHGGNAEEAKIFASCMLRADVRGHNTQGIGLLPYLEELFEEGVMSFGRTFEIVRESVATAVVDGNQGVGHVIGTKAMDLAISKAKEVGLGFVTVRGSSDYGMASNYAIQAQEQGMIGLSMSTGPLLVAPWGGRDAWFCTNPLSIAVPAGKKDPIVIDMATSANSMGKVVLAARDGEKLEGKEVVDKNGDYTDDPLRVILNVMDRESKMTGALLPAGPKGFGMLLLVEFLAGLLSGERTWESEEPAITENRPHFYGQTFLAISIDHFQDRNVFSATVDRMIEALTNARPANGFERVRLHGEGAAETMRQSKQKGVLLREEEWAMVERLAVNKGISIPER